MKTLFEPFILYWIRFCHRIFRHDLIFQYIDREIKHLHDFVDDNENSSKQEFSVWMQDMREESRSVARQREEDRIFRQDLLAVLRRIADK